MGEDAPFKICIHYDGQFGAHKSHYTGGETYDLLVYDVDKLCYWDIKDKVTELGFSSFKGLHYKVPHSSMVRGLHPLCGDVEVIEVAKILMQSTTCHVYVEHGQPNVDEDAGIRVGKLLLHTEVLGSDADDDEELVGINKVYLMGDMDNTNTLSHGRKINDKGKEKVTKASQQQKGERNEGVMASSSSNTITIREPVTDFEGSRLVDNSDIEYSDTEYGSSSTYIDSDDAGSYYSDSSIEDLNVKDNALRRASSTLHYDPNCDYPHFEVGMAFENAIQFKEAIVKYSVKKGCKLHWKKNEPGRQRIVCDIKHGCSWEIYASFDNSDDTFKVKRYYGTHSCFKTNRNKMVTEAFLVDTLRIIVANSPGMSSRQLVDHVKAELNVEVSKYKRQRAKRIIKNELEGSYVEQYKYLRGYGEHILATNPGSSCIIGTEDLAGATPYQFKRMYFCFDGCKRGWKAGCRCLIGLDGSFLKGVYKGILLSAIGRDGNNQMFPVAWAIVDTEDKDNWKWFMELLNIDLECGDGTGMTFISDMHRGILSAREEVFPGAKHRYYARHIYANWAKVYRGEEYKRKFWIIARSSWPEEFDHNMNELKKLNEQAWTDLQRIALEYWCRAFFNEDAYCDVVDNNMCESFNFWIMDARYKAIISLADTLREQVMERIANKKLSMRGWNGDIAPRARDKLEENKNESSQRRLLWDGTTSFEVKHRNDRHAVDLQRRTCTCRAWQMNGIPCPHAICCMYHENLVPKDYVADWYSREKYALSYGFPLKAMCGDKSWMKFHGEPVNPPPIRKRPGRPKKNRRKSKDEPKKISKAVRISRKGRIMTCSHCKQEGHNRVGCPFISTNETNTSGASPSHSKKKRPSAAYHRKAKTVKASRNTTGVPTSINPSQTSITNSNVVSYGSISSSTQQPSIVNDKGKAKVTGNRKQKVKKGKQLGTSIKVNEYTSAMTWNSGWPSEFTIRGGTTATAMPPFYQQISNAPQTNNSAASLNQRNLFVMPSQQRSSVEKTNCDVASLDQRSIFVVSLTGDDMSLNNEDNYWAGFEINK